MIKKILILVIIILVVTFVFCGCKNENKVNIKLSLGEIKTSSSDTLQIYQNVITISKEGRYIFKGQGDNIQIIVDSNDPITIVLDGVTIRNGKVIPITIESNTDVTIICKGKVPSEIIASNNKDFSCIKSKGNLIFEGPQELKLSGYKGIDCKADVSIYTDMSINTSDNCIKGDRVTIASGNLMLHSSKSDGIKANDDIVIESGNINIVETLEGTRGFYSKGDITINGGQIDISTINDCISAKNNIVFSGGNINLSTQDDAIHADGKVHIINADISINACIEGIEGGDIVIDGGNINIISFDDGINVAKSDKEDKSNADLHINNGNITINAQGDGIDANGSIYIGGGVIFVSGANTGDNCALDFDKNCIIDGGLVIATGNIIKAKPPSNLSMQNTIMLIYDEIQTANDDIMIVDENNNIVFTINPTKSYETLILSSEKLITNKSYSLFTVGNISDDIKFISDDKNTYENTIFYSQFEISAKINQVFINTN